MFAFIVVVVVVRIISASASSLMLLHVLLVSGSELSMLIESGGGRVMLHSLPSSSLS